MGIWQKNQKSHFFQKKKMVVLKKKRQKMGTLKKNVARRQNRFSNTIKWKECQMEPNPSALTSYNFEICDYDPKMRRKKKCTSPKKKKWAKKWAIEKSAHFL